MVWDNNFDSNRELSAETEDGDTIDLTKIVQRFDLIQENQLIMN